MSAINDRNLDFANVRARTAGAVPDMTPEEPVGPKVKEHFNAFYTTIRPTREHDGTLARASCVIGSELRIILDGEAHLESQKGEYLIPLRLEDSARIVEAQQRGWETRAYIDFLGYSNETKTLWAEVAFFMWDPSLPALGIFVKNTVGRYCHGDHPRLIISQQEFERILDSGGSWFLIKEVPGPKKEHGDVTFKRRRGLSDWMVAMANQNRIGCQAFAIVFWLAVIALVVWLIFFR